jgi:hypothetical protein
MFRKKNKFDKKDNVNDLKAKVLHFEIQGQVK